MKSLQKKLPWVIGLLGLFLIFTTNPTRLPLILLIIPYVIVFIVLFAVSRKFIRHLKPPVGNKASRKQTGAAVIFAGFPTLCLLLQSIGQLSSRDLVILVILFGVLWFYLSRIHWARDS